MQSQDANVDETSWWEQGGRRGLWGVVTQWVSGFAIRAARGAKGLWELLGEEYGGVLTSDRAKAYNGQPLRWRQLCWAHLRRDFQAMIDRGGVGEAVGRQLLEYADVLLGWWYWVRDGTWARSTFQRYVRFLRGLVRAELAAGTHCACPKTAAPCRELLAVEPALWTFVRVEGIDPTNNAAEGVFPLPGTSCHPRHCPRSSIFSQMVQSFACTKWKRTFSLKETERDS